MTKYTVHGTTADGRPYRVAENAMEMIASASDEEQQAVSEEPERCESCNGRGDYYHENVYYNCSPCLGTGLRNPPPRVSRVTNRTIIADLRAQLAALTAEVTRLKAELGLQHTAVKMADACTEMADRQVARVTAERDRLREALRQACGIAARVIADTQVLPSTDSERVEALLSLASFSEDSKEPAR